MTIEDLQNMAPENEQLRVLKKTDEPVFSVRIPLTISVPTAESKSGILKNYTAYCIKVRFF